jgi:uncharacterized membrane protein YesL
MSLTKFEKINYIGGPFLFGIVLIVCGIIITNTNPGVVHGILLICTGLLCMSLYCVCALLAKIVAAR